MTEMGPVTPIAFDATDGTVSLRLPRPADVPLIVGARDDEFHRWLGRGAENPSPTACIVVRDEVVGWVDYDHDLEHGWLDASEVNVGYFVFPTQRRKGLASAAVELLVRCLQDQTHYQTASLLIDPLNVASLGVARRCHFGFVGDLNGQLYFKRSLL